MSFVGNSPAAGAICDSLRALPAPIFAATRGTGTVIVHVAAVPKRREIAAQVRSALAKCAAPVRVEFHSQSALLAPRSLERLVKQFKGDEVLYDPTESVGRAKALVDAARAVRGSLADKVGGLFYAPRLRTLFVALNAKKIAVGEKVKLGALADVERQVVGALRAAFAGRIADCPAVRVGFGVPAAELVPVDQQSVVGWGRRVARAARRYWKPVAIATLFGFGASAAAAKDPAVSQTNLKITGTGGTVDDEGAWFANGILTAPLGNSFGLQLEGGGGGIDGNAVWGASGHLFTRDPESYLLGLFAAYAAETEFDLDATRVGAEAELYLDQISLLLAAGYQFSSDINETAFGDVEVRWYVTNNFMLSGGGSFDEHSSVGTVGIEWQPGFSALPGLAFNANGAFGDNDFDSIMGGITYYFGANASLKDRHRRQDPDSALFSLFQSVQQEKAKLCAQYGSC